MTTPLPAVPRQRRRHPLLAFVVIVALAIGAATSLLWIDVVAKSADGLNVKDAAALLPP